MHLQFLVSALTVGSFCILHGTIIKVVTAKVMVPWASGSVKTMLTFSPVKPETWLCHDLSIKLRHP